MGKIRIKEDEMKDLVKQAINEVVEEMGCAYLMESFYQGLNNFGKPISLNETNAQRLINRHTENGYAIISACRGADYFGFDKSIPNDRRQWNEVNNERTRELVRLVQENGFTYTPSFGGFNEDGERVYEKSVIVYPNKKNGERDFEGLFNFAIAMCKRYDQMSVLIKAPYDVPKYYTQDGNVDMEFSNDMKFNDIAQEYFTDLHKNTDTKISPNSKPTRFTFLECYIGAKPQGYSERVKRDYCGEKFV